MLFTLIVFLAVLSLLVFAHEFGHFWTARRFGLIPEEFGFGFPPRAWGFYKAKDGKWRTVKGGMKVADAADTIYSLNWLPIGGFVKLGEDDTNINNNSNHFLNKKPWQRLIILLAGVTMNIILAAVLFSLGYMVGLPQTVEGLGRYARITDPQVQVFETYPGTPAAAAGVKSGDVLVSVDGQAIRSSEQLQEYTRAREGQVLDYRFQRIDGVYDKKIAPVKLEGSGSVGIGIDVLDSGIVSYPVPIAVWQGCKTTYNSFIAIIMAFYNMIKGLLTGQGIGGEVAGPVGIAVLTGQVARLGFAYLVQFAALLSINLAIINALPFPALDGGRAIFLGIEKLKGSPVRRELEGTIHYIGFALLMLLVLAVTFKDLSRFGDVFKGIWQVVFG